MTDKELKKLSRAELLEMLLAQSKEVEALQKQLSSRKIQIDNVGSIAEASLQLNDVFQAAQKAADQYLDNIAQIQLRCTEMESESKAQSEKLLSETQEKCTTMEAYSKIKCDEMIAHAKAEAQKWWDEASERLERLYDAREGLREFLTVKAPKEAQD